MPANRTLTPDALTCRDKAVCDGFAAGATRKALGEKFGITKERIGQILNQPGAIHYLAQQAGNTKALIFAKSGEEILTRLDWGGMKLGDLLAIWKAAMPQEVTIKDDQAAIDAAAARLAERTGIPKDRAIVDIRERLRERVG